MKRRRRERGRGNAGGKPASSESVTHLRFIPIFPSRCNDDPVSRYPVHWLLRKVRVQQRRKQFYLEQLFT